MNALRLAVLTAPLFTLPALAQVAPVLAVPTVSAAPSANATRAATQRTEEIRRAETVGVQLTPRTMTRIGASMNGRLIEFPLRDGDRFEMGDVVAKFRCDREQAQLRQTQAGVARTSDLLTRQRHLRELGSYSRQELQVAAAEAAAAQAERASAQAAVADCAIVAPFAGRVSEILVRNHQSVTVGTAMLDVLDDRDLEIEMVIPSAWIARLPVGSRFTVRVSETGTSHEAELTRLSGRVDPVSRTVKVYGRLVAADVRLLPGMSGEAQPLPNVP